MEPSGVTDIATIYQQLKEAVNVTFSSTATQEQRLLAYNFIEKIQEDPSVAIHVGFQLCEVSNDSPVRHLGLQLVENTIKYYWLKLTPELKTHVKDRTTALIIDGTKGISTEEVYIKDKISRLFVEMIKREWPQHWPSLLNELNDLAHKSPTQTELVLLIFVRLSEDIATLKTLENSSRCQDIHHALSDNLPEIFSFFFSLLEEHHFKYSNTQGVSSQEHCKIIQALLITISSYIEWAGFQYLKSHMSQLCMGICKLFSDEGLKIYAAECLLQLSTRKFDSKENLHLNHLLTPDVLHSLIKASSSDVNYHLQKILVQVIINMGQHLLSKISKDEDFVLPPQMELFLNTLLAFTQHSSAMINSATYPIWTQFFKKGIFNMDPSLQKVIPPLIEVSFQKLLRHGFPSEDDDSSGYSKMDFSSDQEYSTFFFNQRCDTWNTLRFAAPYLPDQFYNYFHKCFMECLNSPSTPAPTCEKDICNIRSPIASAWDRQGVILEGVIAKVPDLISYKPKLEKNIQLIHGCLQYTCNDPVILTYVLNCLSGFFVFIKYSPDILPLLLEKFFSACSFSIPGLGKGNRPKKVKHVRKHSASLIVKLATLYPENMLVYFDLIDRKVDELLLMPNELTILEKSTLDQARLILVSYFNDVNKQNSYLLKILHQAKDDWNSVKEYFCSPFILMESVGLTRDAPSEPSIEDSCSKHRYCLHYSMTMFNAVVRRSIIPEETRKALFSGDPHACSPALAHMMPLIQSFCSLARSHNGLWTDEALTALHPKFSKAYCISLPQKMEICCLHSKYNMNMNPELNDSDFVSRMQGFTIQLTEDIYTLLGSLGKLGPDYYKFPQLTEYLIHSVLYNLNKFSDFRLRTLLRSFLKPFFFLCPEECQYSVLLPLLHHICPIIRDHLTTRWTSVKEQIENGNYDPDSTDLDEMFEDATLRLLTRDYIDLLRDILRMDASTAQTADNARENQGNIGVEEDMDVDAKKSASYADQDEKSKIGPLGRAIVLCDPICHSLVSTFLRAFSWMDSLVCKKTLTPMMLMLRGMMQDTPQHLNQDAIEQILISIISGIHFHGQHSENLNEMSDFASTVYELFRPHFPDIRQILLQLPNASATDVDQLDDCISKMHSETANLKKFTRLKKSIFRKTITGIIGKSLSEAFKKEVDIKELAPMFRVPRPKQVQLEDVSSDLNLVALFKELPQTDV